MENRLKEERTKRGLSLEQVGKSVGLATNTISRYETGKREPKLETWKKLADFFGVSVPYLQGIDQTFKELTTTTKYEIISILNYEYFNNLDYDDYKSVREYNGFSSVINRFIQAENIEKYPVEVLGIKNSDDYENFKFDNVEIDPASEVLPPMEHYWTKYFSFLFDDQLLVQSVNIERSLIDTNSLEEYSPSIIKLLESAVNNYIYSNLDSIDQNILNRVKSWIDVSTQNFLISLASSKKKQDVDDAFFDFEDAIKDIHRNIKNIN